MAQYLVRFLLSISILLSSGYSAIYANIANENALENFGDSVKTAFATNSSQQSQLTYSKGKDQEADIFIVNNSKVEEEDDDLDVIQAFLDSANFSALYFTGIFGFLFQNFSHDLHFSKFIPDPSSLRKHVVLQVFRI